MNKGVGGHQEVIGNCSKRKCGLKAVPGAADLLRELRQFTLEIEERAINNDKEARTYRMSFWMLKIPAILSSAFASFLAANHLNVLASILAAAASACVLIDAAYPRWQLLKAHLRASHDLRSLEHEIMNGWRSATLERRIAMHLAASILKASEQTRARIARELRTAETAIGHISTRKQPDTRSFYWR